MPSGLLNRLSVRAFNELWYRKAPARRRDELQTIPTFFHPLDMVGHWNRIYGPRGFLQWQYVLPFGAEDVVRSTIDGAQRRRVHLVPRRAQAVRRRPTPRRCRSRSPAGPCRSTSPPGPGLGPLLDRLDERVADAGGRVYLAKDSRLRPELLPASCTPASTSGGPSATGSIPSAGCRSDLGRRLGLG